MGEIFDLRLEYQMNDDGDCQADERADGQLGGGVAYLFQEVGEFFAQQSFFIQLAGQFINHGTLAADLAPQADRVADGDEGKDAGQGKGSGLPALLQADDGSQGDGDSRVARGHAGIGNQSAPAEMRAVGLDKKLGDLSDNGRCQRHDNEWAHSCLLK